MISSFPLCPEDIHAANAELEQRSGDSGLFKR
jgi:hypothetical protein